MRWLTSYKATTACDAFATAEIQHGHPVEVACRPSFDAIRLRPPEQSDKAREVVISATVIKSPHSIVTKSPAAAAKQLKDTVASYVDMHVLQSSLAETTPEAMAKAELSAAQDSEIQLLDWEEVLPGPSPDTFTVKMARREMIPIMKEVGSFILEGPGLLVTVATKDSLTEMRSRSIWWKVPKDSMSDLVTLGEHMTEVLQFGIKTVTEIRSAGSTHVWFSLDTSESQVTLLNWRELPNTSWREIVVTSLRNKEGWSLDELMDHLEEDELPLLAWYRERADLFITMKHASTAPLLWASAGLAALAKATIPFLHFICLKKQWPPLLLTSNSICTM